MKLADAKVTFLGMVVVWSTMPMPGALDDKSMVVSCTARARFPLASTN